MATKKSASTYDDGVAFKFSFPNCLSLSRADLINGVPKLWFTPSLNAFPMTEEDVAICARLSQENIRPEFVYIAFPSHHPFHGRQYKDYRPSYLRGTSIGELLAEADWKMKCLCAGVKSDETKTKFMSWAENSQLDGLASLESFSDESSGSVFMRCKSVEVGESEEELSFGDPKMTITASRVSSFTKYLTALFDAIAFYDEPLFSKVKEVIKLILAMEWFVRKGVKFSTEWINEHLNHSQLSPRQVVAVKSPKLSPKIVGHVLKQLQLRESATPLESMLAIQLPLPWSAAMMPAIRSTTSIAANATESNFQIKHVRKIGFPAIVSKETMLTISIDDFDSLYQGQDPNSPVGFSTDKDGKPYPVIPNVESWSELFAETVPNPCKALVTSDGKGANIAYGGVSTQSIPVTNVHMPKAPVLQQQPEICAVASTSRKRQSCKRSEVSTPKMVMRPSTNAACLQHTRPLSGDVHCNQFMDIQLVILIQDLVEMGDLLNSNNPQDSLSIKGCQ